MFSWRDPLPTEPIQLSIGILELHTHTSIHAKFQLNRFSPRPVKLSGELQQEEERRKNNDEQTDMYEHLDPLCEQGVQKGRNYCCQTADAVEITTVELPVRKNYCSQIAGAVKITAVKSLYLLQ